MVGILQPSGFLAVGSIVPSGEKEEEEKQIYLLRRSSSLVSMPIIVKHNGAELTGQKLILQMFLLKFPSIYSKLKS